MTGRLYYTDGDMRIVTLMKKHRVSKKKKNLMKKSRLYSPTFLPRYLSKIKLK